MRRSPVPSTITDPEQQGFFDALWRRKRAAVADLSDSATSAEIIAKINEILQADRASGQQESS